MKGGQKPMTGRDATDRADTPKAAASHVGAANEVRSQLQTFAPKTQSNSPHPSSLDMSTEKLYPGHSSPQTSAAKDSAGPPFGDSLLPSGKPKEYYCPGATPCDKSTGGYPVGGRPNYLTNWSENHDDANRWGQELQNNPNLTADEKFTAGKMGHQLERRADDPLREDLARNGTPDQRIEYAQEAAKNWSENYKKLAGKLTPEQTKLADKVQDELAVELEQEEWRKNRFAPP